MDCIFCKIIDGSIPSKTVYEDELVKVIMDINPAANGHMLVLPKKHITDFEEMDNDTLSHINDIAKKIKKVIYSVLNPDGLVLRVNYGIAQEVKHYHLHLIPVYKVNGDIANVDVVYELIMKAIKKEN